MEAILGLAPDSPSLTELGGVVWPMDTKTVPRAFNPAIAKNAEGRLAVVARLSNYLLDVKYGTVTIPSGARSVTNATYFSFLDSGLVPIQWEKISFSEDPKLSRGVEDARLLLRGSEWFLSAVMLETHTPRARVSIYSLDKNLHAAHVKTYEGKLPLKPEKNWMTKLESKSEDFTFVSEMPENLRGGSSLISWGSGYLALCHKTYVNKNKYYNPRTFGTHEGSERTYAHTFVEFDSDLVIKAASNEFFLVSRGIEFGTGLLELEDELLLSFGRNDKESWFGKISKLKVKKLLKEGKQYVNNTSN
jgi:hypothetical protein